MTDKSTVPEQVDANIAPVEETTVDETKVVEEAPIEQPETPAKVEEVKTEQPKAERPVYHMPVAKHLEEKKRIEEKFVAEKAELQAEIERLKAQPTRTASQQAQVDDDVNELATKYNLEPSALADIVALASKKAGGQSQEIQALLQQTKIKQLQEEVRSDFDVKVLPLIKKDFPDATPEFIASAKEQIAELAFSQGYNTLPVEDIYYVSKGKGVIEFKNNYTAEPTGGKGSEHKNLATMSEKEALKLPPMDYKAWSDIQAKKQSKWVD